MNETNIFTMYSEYLKPMGILLIGMMLGYVLQRSRFCIASAFSDFLLFRDGSLLKAVIIMIFVATIGFSILQYSGEEGYVVAIGWRTVIGGVLFGIGMSIAGSCAVGTLMRIGEGYVLFFPALLGLIIGGAFGAYHYDYWGNDVSLNNTYFLPDHLGWGAAVLAQLVILSIVFFLIKYSENK